MGFGGSAAAANAAIKRNAAQRNKRVKRTAPETVRKRFRQQLQESLHRERVTVTTVSVLVSILVLSILLWLLV